MAPLARRPGRPDVRRRLDAVRAQPRRDGGERRDERPGQEDPGDLVKLVIFIVVTTLATGVLVVLIGNLTLPVHPRLQGGLLRRHRRGQGRRHPDRRGQGRQRQEGRDRRPHPRAGRRSPSPKSSIVTKSSTGDHPLPQPGRPALHLADPGRGRPRRRCRTNSTIPMSRTQPALDLTVLFNGFKPLFAALSPGRHQPALRRGRSRSSRARAATSTRCCRTRRR